MYVYLYISLFLSLCILSFSLLYIYTYISHSLCAIYFHASIYVHKCVSMCAYSLHNTQMSRRTAGRPRSFKTVQNHTQMQIYKVRKGGGRRSRRERERERERDPIARETSDPITRARCPARVCVNDAQTRPHPILRKDRTPPGRGPERVATSYLHNAQLLSAPPARAPQQFFSPFFSVGSPARRAAATGGCNRREDTLKRHTRRAFLPDFVFFKEEYADL